MTALELQVWEFFEDLSNLSRWDRSVEFQGRNMGDGVDAHGKGNSRVAAPLVRLLKTPF
jgi:hypothetical protein